MNGIRKPVVICAPEPRSLDLIFHPDQLERLRSRYTLIETTGGNVAALDGATLAAVQYILGQPPLSRVRFRLSAG